MYVQKCLRKVKTGTSGVQPKDGACYCTVCATVCENELLHCEFSQHLGRRRGSSNSKTRCSKQPSLKANN